MQAVVNREEAIFPILGDEHGLRLTGFGPVIIGSVESLRTRFQIFAFITAVQVFFLAALDVRADTAFTDCRIGTAIVIRTAGAAPLSQEAVIAGETAVGNRVETFTGCGNEAGLPFAAILNSGAVVSLFRIKRIPPKRFAREILTIAAKLLALRDSAFRDIAVAVKRFSLRRNTSSAVTGLFIRTAVTIQSAIRGDFGFMHIFILLLPVSIIREYVLSQVSISSVISRLSMQAQARDSPVLRRQNRF